MKIALTGKKMGNHFIQAEEIMIKNLKMIEGGKECGNGALQSVESSPKCASWRLEEETSYRSDFYFVKHE